MREIDVLIVLGKALVSIIWVVGARWKYRGGVEAGSGGEREAEGRALFGDVNPSRPVLSDTCEGDS